MLLGGLASVSDFCSLSGEEVALYCAKYLPEIIKDQKAYKEGKLQKVRDWPCPETREHPYEGEPLFRCLHLALQAQSALSSTCVFLP